MQLSEVCHPASKSRDLEAGVTVSHWTASAVECFFRGLKTRVLAGLLIIPARELLVLVYKPAILCARARACVYGMGKWLKNGLLSMICFFSILLLGRYNKACKMAAIGWHVAHRHFIWLAEDLTFLGGD